jgi:hypothetical protein
MVTSKWYRDDLGRSRTREALRRWLHAEYIPARDEDPRVEEVEKTTEIVQSLGGAGHVEEAYSAPKRWGYD